MNKLVAMISNHPMFRVFLSILAVVLFPVNSLLFTPTTAPIQASVSDKKDSKQSKKQEEKDSEDDAASIYSAKSLENSPINNQALFPTINHVNNAESLLSSSIKPCSTGISTNFLPYKNEQGEIEWAFTEDSHQYPMYGNDQQVHQISPTVSNSSNSNSYSHSDKVFDHEEKRSENYTPNSLSTPSPPNSTGKGVGMSTLSDDKAHQCPHCESTFKLRGYLTRHLKKHSVKKAYSCPFHKFSIYIDENDVTHKCHPSGGFSRRDTYKTHLKSRHFKYPKGTKTKERSKTDGHCSMCGEYFPNSEIWCEIHIEGGDCKFLPSGFKGKSRIKNRLKKQLKKKGIVVGDNGNDTLNLSNFLISNFDSLSKLDLELDGDNDADGDSNNDSNDNESFNDEPKPSIKVEAHDDKGVASSSPNVMSDFSQSPDSEQEVVQNKFQTTNLSPQSNTNSVNHMNGPDSSVYGNSFQESYIGNQVSSSPEAARLQDPSYPHPQQINFVQNQPDINTMNANVNLPLNSQVQPIPGTFGGFYDPYNTFKYSDYDDEFCLDIDQLNQFSPKSLESPLSSQNMQPNHQLNSRMMDQHLAAFYQQTQSQLQSMSNPSTNQSSFSSESSNSHPEQYSQQPVQPVPQAQQQGQHGQSYSMPQRVPMAANMGMNPGMSTGMNYDEVHFDQYNLQPQPQFVQY